MAARRIIMDKQLTAKQVRAMFRAIDTAQILRAAGSMDPSERKALRSELQKLSLDKLQEQASKPIL